MTPLLFFTWASLFTSQTNEASCTQYNQDKYPALIYEIPWEDTYFDGTKNVSWFTFCPASTEQEKKINDQVSISGHSLFLRNTHGPKDNFTVNICDEPIKSSTFYNSESHQYEIGYELYYEEDRIKFKDGAYFWYNIWYRQGHKPEKYLLGENKYHVYRFVNNKNEVINNDENKENLLNDGSSKWIFYWTSVIKITASGDNKQIKIENDCFNHISGPEIVDFRPPDEVLQSKCDDYGLPGMDLKIYISSENSHNSKESQNQALPSIKKLKPLTGKLYGSLKLLQIIPVWYFGESWAKAASCSSINMIPIWRSIADGQFKRVDLYILALERKMNDDFSNWRLMNVHFGASGVLTYKNESGIDSNQQRKLYSMPDNSNFSQIIPVPKIIYRVIEAAHLEAFYAAIIVIHNDPNPISDRDRVCNESEEVSGWEAIKNDDPRTGITYVCPYTAMKVEHEKLGFQAKSNAIKELSLNSMLHYGWNDLICDEYVDRRSEINQEFEKLLNITAGISF